MPSFTKQQCCTDALSKRLSGRQHIQSMKYFNLVLLVIFGPYCLNAIAQQPTPAKEEHSAGVNARGDQAMGFSHEKTTHHFHLLAIGGAIDIQSNGPTDSSAFGDDRR